MSTKEQLRPKHLSPKHLSPKQQSRKQRSPEQRSPERRFKERRLARRSRFTTLVVGLLTIVAVATVGLAQDQSILDDPMRPAEERARDAGSKPLMVYEFFGVEPGMTVVDLMPGSGYNTHLLSKIVGPEGKVWSGPDRRGRVTERKSASGDTWANVEVFDDIGSIAAGSVDVIITVRNVHDLEGRGSAAEAYASYLRALKPGGIFGVVDARTPDEGVDSDTHRINQQTVIDHVTAAGFELVDTSEMLANPDDRPGASEEIPRYEIDRMVVKFRRPTS